MILIILFNQNNYFFRQNFGNPSRNGSIVMFLFQFFPSFLLLQHMILFSDSTMEKDCADFPNLKIQINFEPVGLPSRSFEQTCQLFLTLLHAAC